jgi:hypothetical protein
MSKLIIKCQLQWLKLNFNSPIISVVNQDLLDKKDNFNEINSIKLIKISNNNNRMLEEDKETDIDKTINLIKIYLLSSQIHILVLWINNLTRWVNSILCSISNKFHQCSNNNSNFLNLDQINFNNKLHLPLFNHHHLLLHNLHFNKLNKAQINNNSRDQPQLFHRINHNELETREWKVRKGKWIKMMKVVMKMKMMNQNE